MFAVEWTKEAVRRLGRLDKSIAEDVLRRVSRLSATPERYGKRLRHMDLWSLRVGDYRVLYAIDFTSNRVVIVTVGPRRSVYDR